MPERTSIVPMTSAMVRSAAKLHIRSLPDSRTARMGEFYMTSFMEWFRTPEHGGIALVAVDRLGDVVGYVVGAPLGYPKVLSRDLFWSSAVSVAVRPWLILTPQFRTGALGRLRLLTTGDVPQHSEVLLPPPTMSLVAMGVSPLMRRRNIGVRLLDVFEERALELRMRSIRLSTRSDNAVARRLYEGRDWKLLSDSGELVYYFRILDRTPRIGGN